MAGGKQTRGNPTRALAIALALLFAVFLTQAAAHSHQDGQSDSTCQVCQAAHVTQGPLVTTLATHSLFAFEHVRPANFVFHQEFFVHDSPSRAPPYFSL